jgi:hypothetical protein
MVEARNFIAGEWVAASDTTPDINPSNTDDVVGHFPKASVADAERAILAARDAFPAWSRSAPQLRHDILKRIGDELLARKDEIGAILSRPPRARSLRARVLHHRQDGLRLRPERALRAEDQGQRVRLRHGQRHDFGRNGVDPPWLKSSPRRNPDG